jgi:hypothetical protein
MQLFTNIIEHPRMPHRPDAPVKTTPEQVPVTSRLRNEGLTMDVGTMRALLATLSDGQRQELYRDVDSEGVMMVAIEERAIARVAERLAVRRRSIEVMTKVRARMRGDIAAIVDAMVGANTGLDRISDFLVFMRFGEFLPEESHVWLLAPLLAEISPAEFRVRDIAGRKKNKWLEGFAHCLLLRHPEFFERNEDAFALFH